MENNIVKTKPVITEIEFRQIFDLDNSYKISKKTLKDYVKYLEGSYLLWEELNNINEVNFNIIFKKEKLELQAFYDGNYCRSYQSYIMALGSPPKIEVCYLDSERDKSTPFWTYTKFEKQDKQIVIEKSYESFINVLQKIKIKYLRKYNIHLKYRNYLEFGRTSGIMKPIYLDGVEFPDIYVKNKGIIESISSYEIIQSISNKYNVFTGPLLDPVYRILEPLMNNKN